MTKRFLGYATRQFAWSGVVFSMALAGLARPAQAGMEHEIRPVSPPGRFVVRGLILAEEEPVSEERYEKEELGVNAYTAPAIGDIFDELDRLRPLPFDQLWRELPSPSGPIKREQRAMIFGQLVADGFLVVAAEKRGLVDQLGRALIREARGLGVGDRVMKHSASLSDLGKAGQWAAVRQELISTQADVENAMVELRDQKVAHLISLGGWFRGLEIGAGAVVARYSPERAAVLMQPSVVDYFDDEIKTLPPSIVQDPLFDHVREKVKAIRAIMRKPAHAPLSAADVRTLQTEAHDLNLEICQSSPD